MMYKYNDGGRDKYFKGVAGDCSVRALAILLKKDYKKIYDSFNTCGDYRIIGRSPRNGVDNMHLFDVYQKHGLIYEDIPGCPDDYDFEKADFDYIIQYEDHLQAVISNVVNDIHDSKEFCMAEGIWVRKRDHDKLLKILQ